MVKIAQFKIEDVFEIKGRGVVFAGRILDGVISVGNQIEFELNNKLQRRTVIGVEGIRCEHPDMVNIGLVVEHDNENENEVIALKKSIETLSVINIFKDKLTLGQLIEWLSTKTIKEKILFNELLLSDLTVMNRAIWSDENTSDKSKVDTLKWSNELAHRIWNIIFDLKRNKDNQSETRLGDNIHFCTKQSKALAGHLAATTKSTINRFYCLIEENSRSDNTDHN